MGRDLPARHELSLVLAESIEPFTGECPAGVALSLQGITADERSHTLRTRQVHLYYGITVKRPPEELLHLVREDIDRWRIGWRSGACGPRLRKIDAGALDDIVDRLEPRA